MAHIQEKDGRYQLRWRTPDDKHRTRVFTRKADALREKARVEADISRGVYMDPSRSTVAEVAERWLDTKRAKKASTLSGYRTILDNHIRPKLGARQVAKLRPTDIESFVSGLEADGAALPGRPYWHDLIDAERDTTYRGDGVWVAVLDSGFYPNWRDYFDESTVLTNLAAAFVAVNGNANENQWDVGSDPHGMATAATVVGHRFRDGLNEGGWGQGYATGAAGTY